MSLFIDGMKYSELELCIVPREVIKLPDMTGLPSLKQEHRFGGTVGSSETILGYNILIDGLQLMDGACHFMNQGTFYDMK